LIGDYHSVSRFGNEPMLALHLIHPQVVQSIIMEHQS